MIGTRKRKPEPVFPRSLIEQRFQEAERLYFARLAKSKSRGLPVEEGTPGLTTPGISLIELSNLATLLGRDLRADLREEANR